MALNLDALPAWKNLKDLKRTTDFSAYHSYFKNDYFSVNLAHNHLNQEVFQSLMDLPKRQMLQTHLSAWSKGCFDTDLMPRYVFLRRFSQTEHPYYQQSIIGRQRMKVIVEKIRQNIFLSSETQRITDIVNIGIGGSDLGPRMTLEALELFKNTDLRFHFISDADPYALRKTLAALHPNNTLFLVSSKSFETEETLQNAEKVQQWFHDVCDWKQHMMAITAHVEKAQSMGYQHILPIGEWVVGRYSCCSAINLILALMIGFEAFEDFLQGATMMDDHFFNAPIEENIPILLALLGIWNINFLEINTHLLLIYDFRLRHFIDYVQQMDMESNGKSVNQAYKKINYSTAPIIWGGLGNQAHHSYYQLLAQGKHRHSIDFITVSENDEKLINQLCRSRIEALRNGIATARFQEEICPQTSLTHLHLKDLNPASLGALIALYEHKVFTQAWLWNINPFDQPGVDSAKRNALRGNVI